MSLLINLQANLFCRFCYSWQPFCLCLCVCARACVCEICSILYIAGQRNLFNFVYCRAEKFATLPKFVKLKTHQNRNVSSAGEYARKKMLECDRLVKSIVDIVTVAVRTNNLSHKSIENCVCILRNLSYACQEVADPNYLKKRMEVAKMKGMTRTVFK